MIVADFRANIDFVFHFFHRKEEFAACSLYRRNRMEFVDLIQQTLPYCWINIYKTPPVDFSLIVYKRTHITITHLTLKVLPSAIFHLPTAESFIVSNLIHKDNKNNQSRKGLVVILSIIWKIWFFNSMIFLAGDVNPWVRKSVYL